MLLFRKPGTALRLWYSLRSNQSHIAAVMCVLLTYWILITLLNCVISKIKSFVCKYCLKTRASITS
jgi:hypothetical protein